MFCTNCGEQINQNAVACPKCGFNPTSQNNFCGNCGNKVNPEAVVCISCGAALKGNSAKEIKKIGNKSWLATLLLCMFLGLLGIHRFYTDHKLTGFIQLLTLGGFGIWTFIDFILIITDNFYDAQGYHLKK